MSHMFLEPHSRFGGAFLTKISSDLSPKGERGSDRVKPEVVINRNRCCIAFRMPLPSRLTSLTSVLLSSRQLLTPRLTLLYSGS